MLIPLTRLIGRGEILGPVVDLRLSLGESPRLHRRLGYVSSSSSASAFYRFDDSMEGIAIGLVNITDELHCVQLGLLNIV